MKRQHPGGDDEDDDDDVGSWDDEYVGIIPMLCSRCVRFLKRKWPFRRAKRYVVVFSVVMCVCGCVMVCVALWMHICLDRLFYGVLLLDNPTSPPIVLHRLPLALFVVAVIIAVVGFLGSCGAFTECVCFLLLHVVLSVLCIATQIMVAILAAAFRDTVHASMAVSMQYQLRNLYNSTGARLVNSSSITHRVTSAWDHIQQQLECCGSVGPTDYHYSAWFNHTPDSDGSFVPPSCCSTTAQLYYCQFEAAALVQHDRLDRPSVIKTQGCYAAMVDLFASYHPLMVFIIFAIDIFLIIDLISALLVVRTVRRKQSDYTWYDDELAY